MAVQEVLQLGNPKLREIAAPVVDPEGKEVALVLQDLRDTLARWRKETGYGRAISAPQIGVSQRIVLVQLPGSEPWALVNPVIVEASEEKYVVWDGCLSFLSIFMQVKRYRQIVVRYQDTQARWQEAVLGMENDLSELLQHEIDHLDGILAIDRVRDITSVCTRQEFERRFMASSPYKLPRSA